MLLARDSIVGIIIPSSISLPASLFTRSVMHHPVTNSFGHIACKAYDDVLPSGPRDTSPTIGVTNPILDLCQFKQTPSETPVEHIYNHPVML